MTDNRPPFIAFSELTQDTQHANGQLLHNMALALLVLDLVVFLALLLVAPSSVVWIVPELGMVAVGGLASLIAARRKHIQAASAFFVLTTWLVAANITIGNGGLSGPFIVVPILVSFLLLDAKTRTLVLICTLTLVVTVWFSKTLALLPDRPTDPTIIGLVDVAMLVLLTWLFSVVAGSARQAMQHAHQQEKLLEEHGSRLRHQRTELKNAEEAYELLVNNSIQGIVIWQNGRHVFVNRAYTQMTGYSLDELNAMEDGLRAIIHPDDYSLVWNRIQGRLKGEDVLAQYEIRLVHKDGAIRWAELAAGLITYQGEPAIQTTFSDITERRQTQDALRASEALFRSLTENAPIGVVMTSGPGTIVYVNDELCRLVGWQTSELIGQPVAMLFDEQALKTNTGFRDALSSKVTLSPRRFTVQARRKEGATFWGEFSTNLIQDASGTDSIIGLLLDVTEHHEAAHKQLELAVEKQKVDMLRQFIGNVSHDLKTPLTIINTSLYLLDKTDDLQQRAEKLEDIRIQTEQLGNMIQDLLAMSRLEQDAALDLEPIRLDELAHDVLRQFRLRFQAKNQTASVTLETAVPTIQGDPGELKRVLSNLIENAINYTPVSGKINCTLMADADSVKLSLADTGMGIDPADLPHIFDRFYRSASARAVLGSGAGLGLAIVKKIVELHAGTIYAESQSQAGTVFHVTLPLVKNTVATL